MKDDDEMSAPMLCSGSFAEADDWLAPEMRSFWESLDESDKTFFVFVVMVVAFLWYGLILGMAREGEQ